MIQPVSTENELLACFDKDGHDIEPRKRSELHAKPYVIWHGVADIWIVNEKGEILCSRRSLGVHGNPGKWQTFFGGHVRAGDAFLDTALRELEEEVGIIAHSEKLLLVELGTFEEHKHFYQKFVYFFDVQKERWNFQDGEVINAQWFSFQDYWQDRISNSEKWCNGMNEEQYKAVLQKIGNLRGEDSH
ncbi:MAG: NUDIX hydrolase [Caldilineaceae bacterium]